MIGNLTPAEVKKDTTKPAPIPKTPPPPGVDVGKIMKEKRIEGSYPADTWIHLFTHLLYKKQRGDKIFGIGCLVTGILLFLGLGSVSRSEEDLVGLLEGILSQGTVFLGLLTFLILPFMLFLVASIFRRKIEFSRVEKVLLPLVHLLKAEVRPREPILLGIDLRGWKIREKKGNPIKHKDEKKTIDTFYGDPWLIGEVRLADHSRLQFRFTNRVRERETTFRRSSGKVKTRIKPKNTTIIETQLAVSNRRYEGAYDEPATVANGKIKVRSKPERTLIRIKQKHKGAEEELGATPLVEATSIAYRQVSIPGSGSSAGGSR